MKKVKTDWRNRLQNTALTSCLRILLEGPNEDDFNPVPAIDYWNGAPSRSRRPFQSPHAVKETNLTQEISDDEDYPEDEEEIMM